MNLRWRRCVRHCVGQQCWRRRFARRANSMANGSVLLISKENRLVFPLHLMAAARGTSFCPLFLRRLSRKELSIGRSFGDGRCEPGRPRVLSFHSRAEIARRAPVLDTGAPDESRCEACDVSSYVELSRARAWRRPRRGGDVARPIPLGTTHPARRPGVDGVTGGRAGVGPRRDHRR